MKKLFRKLRAPRVIFGVTAISIISAFFSVGMTGEAAVFSVVSYIGGGLLFGESRESWD